MKRTLIPALCTFLLINFAQTAQANDIQASAKITDVTVFADRAAITQTAKVTIPPGSHKVVLENLPIGLFPDTLRAEGIGNTSFTLGAISHKVINQTDLVAPREKEINEQIRTLEDQKALVNAEKAAIEKQKVFLDSLMDKAATRSREEIADFNLKPDQWSSAASVITDGFATAEKDLITKNIEIRNIDENISKLKRDLSSLRTGSKQSYSVIIPVETTSITSATLHISYQMSGASWRPVYDARLTSQSGELEITQYGEVTQRTGQNWQDVNLTLSTAQPQRGASLPPLSPKWVSLYEPHKKAQMFSRSSGAAYESDMVAQNLSMDALHLEEEIAAAPATARMRTAQIETGGLNAEYKIVGKSDVSADGTQTKLLIGPFDATSKMEIHVKPQLSQSAYLVSKATLTGEAPILPGSVSLFADGNFVGQNHFPLLRPGKSHNLYFGIDDQIEVKRNVLEDKSGESGLLGRDSKKEQRFITTIQNMRKAPIDLVLTESVPVSKNDKIETEILKDHTTPGYREDIENKKGIIQWSQKLDTGQKSDIKLGWKVQWPKDTHINGL